MKKAIKWFSGNHVAANFLMLAVIVAGFVTWFQLRKEVMAIKGTKGRSTKSQRGWYKFFKNTGIIWLL